MLGQNGISHMTGFDPGLLKPLNVLLAERSVTRAAKLLNISQSTMSGILARLREQLGDPLLVRDGMGMQLTHRALTLVPLAKQAAMAIEQLSADTSEPALADDRRTFSVMASDYGLQLILLEALTLASEQAPHVRFLVLPITSSVEGVFDGLADLCFTGDTVATIEPLPAGLIVTQVLLRETYLCAVQGGRNGEERMTSEDYARKRRVTVTFDRSSLTLEDRVLLAKPERPAQIVVPSFHAVGAFVQRAEAISLVPKRIGHMLHAIYGVGLVQPAFECRATEFRMLWHIRNDQNPFHRWFRRLVYETAQSVHLG
ncbi:MAG: Transcriptional regulator [Bradyrhizobium sp.]|nr:Transcriptional regulator [Bradyrhizobium sp.]